MEGLDKKTKTLIYIFSGFLIIAVFIGVYMIFKKPPEKATKEEVKFSKTESKEAREEQEKIKENYRIENETDKEIEYNKDDLISSHFSDKTKEVIPDELVDKYRAFIIKKATDFDLENLDTKVFSDSKNFNSYGSEKFKEEILPLMDDVTTIMSLPYSISDKRTFIANTSLIKNDNMYALAMLSIHPDYRSIYTIDEDSVSCVVSKEISKETGNKVRFTSEVMENVDDDIYNLAKKKYIYGKIDKVKSVNFTYEDEEYKLVFIEAETEDGSEKLLLGLYPTKENREYPTIKLWRALIKNKRDMRDSSTNLWQEGGPQGGAEDPRKEDTSGYDEKDFTNSELQEMNKDSVISPGKFDNVEDTEEGGD